MVCSDKNWVVRAIAEEEIEPHFELMCQVFNLDESVARPIYFGDPFFDLAHKRVLADDETRQIVSCLTVVPATLRLSGGATLRMAGIAGVGTRPSDQCQGHASQLLAATVSDLATELGYPLAALVSSRPDFYRRFGWECCATTFDWSASPNLFPAYSEGQDTRVLTQTEMTAHAGAIHALHERARSGQVGTLLRDERRWHCIETFSRGRRVGVWKSKAGLEAYVAFEERAEDGKRLVMVQEMIAMTEAGRRALVGFLAQQSGVEGVRGRMNASDFAAFGLDRVPGLEVTQSEGMMLRVTDLEPCLAAIAESGLFTPILQKYPSGLTIRIDNAILSPQNKPIRLFPIMDSGRKPKVAMSPADEIEGHWISADVSAFTQLYIGYASATQLFSKGRLRASGPQAVMLADHLFPPSDPYLAPPDTF